MSNSNSLKNFNQSARGAPQANPSLPNSPDEDWAKDYTDQMLANIKTKASEIAWRNFIKLLKMKL